MFKRGRAPHAAGGRSIIGGTPQRMLLIVCGWVLLVSAFQIYVWQRMIHWLDLFQGLVQFCQAHPVAARWSFLGWQP